jgi:hypothetical protein
LWLIPFLKNLLHPRQSAVHFSLTFTIRSLLCILCIFVANLS